MLYLITPTLGAIRNYVKYKRFDIFCYIRTPFIYFILQFALHLRGNSRLLLLILERWLLLLIKSIKSLIYNDHYRKKHKYIQKYKLKYENDSE